MEESMYDIIGTTGSATVVAERPNFKFCLREDLKTLCDTFNSKVPLKPGQEDQFCLLPSNFLPTQADPESTGYDVRCASPDGVILNPGHYVKIPLGFRMFAPKGWWLALAPRSSTFMKLHLHPLYGIIDETFENEMMFVGQYLPDQSSMYNASQQKVIQFGDRIGQLMPVRRQLMTVSEVSASEYLESISERMGARGTGGFGSTGQK